MDHRPVSSRLIVLLVSFFIFTHGNVVSAVAATTQSSSQLPVCGLNFSPKIYSSINVNGVLSWETAYAYAASLLNNGLPNGTGGSLQLGGHTQFAPFYPNAIGRDIDVFLIAGQSNAVGQGDASESPQSFDDTAYQYFNNSILVAQDPIGYANTGSAWPQFARTYFEHTGRRVGFVPAASNGSTLFAQNQVAPEGGGGGGNWSPSGNLYGESVVAVIKALSAFKAANYIPHFKGVIWNQGEGDAGGIGDFSKQAYSAALLQLINNYKSVFGKDLPFYLFQIGTYNRADQNPDYVKGYELIREAQNAVENPSQNIYVIDRDEGGYMERGLMLDQGGQFIHFNQVALNEMGKMAAQNIAFTQPPQTKTYTMTVTGKGGTNTCTTTVQLAPPPPACSLYFEPATVAKGGYAKLIWNTSDALAASLDNGLGGSLTQNNVTVIANILAPKLYTMTVSGPGGEATCSAEIKVQ